MTTLIDWPELLLSVDNDEDFLKEVLEEMFRETEKAEADILAGLAADPINFDKIQKAGHLIKGSASYMKCESMKSCCYEIQLAGQAAMKAGSDEPFLAEIKTAFDKFQSTFTALRAEIKARNG